MVEIFSAYDSLSEIANRIRAGKIGIFPAKNAYMLVGLPAQADVIREIKRKQNRRALVNVLLNVEQLPLVVDSSYLVAKNTDMLSKLSYLNAIWLLPSNHFQDNFTDTKDTVGVYFAHSNIWEVELARELKTPFIATSSNISGQPTPFSVGDISKDVLDNVNFCLDIGKMPEEPDYTIFDIATQTFERDKIQFVKQQINNYFELQ